MDMFQISSCSCEICHDPAKVAMNDKNDNLHYSCLDHVKELWDKIGKP